MLEITSVTSHASHRASPLDAYRAAHRKPSASAGDAKPATDADRIEISPAAREFAPEARGVTPERMHEIRNEIAQGTYLSDDKLDAAVERLTRALLGESASAA